MHTLEGCGTHMPRSHNQVENERFILEKFLSAMNMQADSIDRGPLVKGNHKPDFVVCIDGRRIGIEETTYYRRQRPNESQPRQAKENAWSVLRRVIERARQNYSGLSEIRGAIRFKDFRLPPSKEYDSFANELFEFAMSKIGELSSEHKRYRTFSEKYSHLSRYLEYLELKHVGCYMYWDWRHKADGVGLQEGELYSIIRDKIDKHVQSQFDEDWLLITSGTQMSQQMGLQHLFAAQMNEFSEIIDLLAESPFDRIYIYDYVQTRVVLWTMSKRWQDVLPAELPH